MNSERSNAQIRRWIAVMSMMTLVACGGGGTSAATAPSPAPESAPTPAPAVQTLSISTSAGGTVLTSPAGSTCATSCSATYAEGAAMTLTAQPSPNFQFDGWSSACTGNATNCLV